MDLPKIAATEPAKVELEAGKKYAYCTCGLSETQPFCDGKHKGTDFVPNVFEAEEAKTVYFCQCKKTGTAPYCDGTHKGLAGCGDDPGGSCSVEDGGDKKG